MLQKNEGSEREREKLRDRRKGKKERERGFQHLSWD